MSLSNRLVAFVDTSPYAESVCDYVHGRQAVAAKQ